MKLRPVSVHILTVAMLVSFRLAGIAAAQEAQIEPGSERPMFTYLPATLHEPRNVIEAASTPLETWNGNFTHNGTTYSYNMGTVPFSNTMATITTCVIPIKIVITSRTGVKTTFDRRFLLRL